MASLSVSIAVFVPSHIHYDGQTELLSSCLYYLVSQSFEVNVFVSISFEEKYKMDILDIMKQFKQVKFMLQPKQLFQVEHIEMLTNKYAKVHDVIMFCDDDDYFALGRSLSVIELKHGTLLFVEHKSCVNNDAEYCQYAVTSKLLITFFEKMRKMPSLMRCHVGKVFLNYYLFHHLDIVKIENMQTEYIKNYSNIHSLSNTKLKWRQQEDDDLLDSIKDREIDKKIFQSKTDKVKNVMNIVNKFCYEHLLI